ncbi:MAG: nucleotidyl transferase AbiEii/AbiGii toxin family protein [Planctomycetes bacterium]|jgi:predicted nucleotidyltransferase component of viral defense system|nr:nucleotidyl transferase AbiEii/AbiGii toxin family protein [Planctomycetota bacterium]
MSVRLIEERLRGYGCRSAVEEEQALREITQEILLAALGRTDFFGSAGFHGGTCLRVFHSLNRFSEDLDFALRTPDDSFDLAPHLAAVARELSAFGFQIEVQDRSRAGGALRKAFLKDDALGRLVRLDYRPSTGPLRKLRIKIEVDVNPPAEASFETRILDFPFPSSVCTFDLPSLFAGKVHALLCREYLKGRDWYDFVWFTARRTPVNHGLLSAALDQAGPWTGTGPRTDDKWCRRELRARIETLDVPRLREEVRRFVRPVELPSLEVWSREFFLAQCAKLA